MCGNQDPVLLREVRGEEVIYWERVKPGAYVRRYVEPADDPILADDIDDKELLLGDFYACGQRERN